MVPDSSCPWKCGRTSEIPGRFGLFGEQLPANPQFPGTPSGMGVTERGCFVPAEPTMGLRPAQERGSSSHIPEPGETFLKVTHGDPPQALTSAPGGDKPQTPPSVLPRGDWEKWQPGSPDLSRSLPAASISLYCPLS